MRLDKFICKSTELTRTEAKKLLKSGVVKVNDVVIKDPSTQVHENNTITLNNGASEQTLSARTSRYIMMHKPKNTICSNVDEIYPSLLHYIDLDKAFDLHIAGRLDADTTGLVLITDDGRWSHNIISPKKDCPKTYRVQLRDKITQDKQQTLLQQFTQGIQLQGEKELTKPAILKINTENEVLLTITEGKYHQVKRMFAAVGNKVVGLHREQIGTIKLDDELSSGQWRFLSPEEIISCK